MNNHLYLPIMKITLLLLTTSLFLFACKQDKTYNAIESQGISIATVRPIQDTIGFAQYSWQLDSIIDRIAAEDKTPIAATYKAAISPHDDYAYAGGLFYKTLKGIKAKTVILIGVAHRATNFDLQDKLIFDSNTYWNAPNGHIKISPLRDSLIAKLHANTFIVHDSMMALEHSLEAITPFLQKMNPQVEIVPILVPFMKFEDMKRFSEDLSNVLAQQMKLQNLAYGKDIAIVISNDAIHYGNTDWGGGDLAPFGVDEAGNKKALEKDRRIIDFCLLDPISEEKIRTFNLFTVNPNDYKSYNWTWCGRYSVPFGLLTANKLNQKLYGEPLFGTLVDYRSSLTDPHIEVIDIGMGHTAPASETHWVAFVGVGYE